MQQCFTYFNISLINAHQDAQWRTSKYQRSTSRWLSNVDLVRIIQIASQLFKKCNVNEHVNNIPHFSFKSYTFPYQELCWCHNLCHNSPTWWVVRGGGVSLHGPTITPPLLTTRHVDELWHKLCNKLRHQHNSHTMTPRQCAHYTMVEFGTANGGFQFWYICQGLLLISMPMQMRFIKMNFNR